MGNYGERRTTTTGAARVKQRIVKTAREIARTEGWSNVTLRKIADRIEHTHAALSSYFANAP